VTFKRIINYINVHQTGVLLTLVLLLFFVGLSPFNFIQFNMACITADDGLKFLKPGSAYTSIPSKKLHSLNQFTIYIDLTSSSKGLSGFEKILSYAISQDEMNFIVGQWKDGLGFSLRADGKSQEIHSGVDNIVVKDKRIRCVIRYNGSDLAFYVNGKVRNRSGVGVLRFDAWDVAYPLVLGTDANGRSQWTGSIHRVAIYERALSQREIAELFRQDDKGSGSGVEGITSREGRIEVEKRPLIHYLFMPDNTYETVFRGKRATGVRDMGKGKPDDLVIPKRFAPYKRVFLHMPSVDVKDYRPNIIQDILVNFLGFVPLGILLCMIYLRQDLHVGTCIALAVMTGFAVSLTIELLQAFLPTRYSGMLDIFMNILGTFIGSCAIAYATRRLRAHAQAD
jgi:VanZ family protein